MQKQTPKWAWLRRSLGPARLFVALALLLGLVQLLFQDNQSQNNVVLSGGAAAQATQVPLNPNLPLALPSGKAEAAAFVNQHSSLFNFDEVNRLRAERAQALGGQPDNFQPVPKTPAPNAGATTPQPTSNIPLKPRQLYAAATCSGVTPPDPYEPDDSALSIQNRPLSFSGGVAQQSHTLAPHDGGDDVDWVKFHIDNYPATYKIETLNLTPPTTDNTGAITDDGVNTFIELWKGDTITNTTLISTNDDIDTSGRSGLSYTPTSADTGANVFFYVKIYGKVGVSCPGYYDIKVSYTLAATATPTTSASPTVSPTPDPCRDQYEDDSNPGVAKELRVSYGPQPPFGGTPGAPDNSSPNNNVQTHNICPVGDQDWYYVDLVKGKPYSLFTSNLQGGLDTLLILFEKDDQGNLKPLYASDDYPGLGLASRIDWVVPATLNTPTGDFKRYYFAVKDVSGHGQPGMSYNITLSSPGDPRNDCVDAYEDDGLPQTAKEILVNEAQNHVICPDGDADWVRFFAKAGRTYDLRVAFDPTPGEDTILYVFNILFDPNDPSKVEEQDLIGSNDDVSASDLSSEITFKVPQDGIYYAQVKNNGDIGRRGFYYRLSLTTGGQAPVQPTTGITPAPTKTPSVTANASTQTASAATATIQAAIATATAKAEATQTATASATSILPNTTTQSFADPAFQQLWNYSDLAVAQNKTPRSWEWGPRPGVVRLEPYAQAPGSQRQVQYFDKSRMEINNPKGDRNSPWFVTNGLLVREMISGQIAQGENESEQHAPARIQMAGDITPDNPAPTYAQFAPLITSRADDRTGQTLSQGLDTSGSVVSLSAPPENLKLGYYSQETGHNIPQVFYDYMQSHGTVYDNGYKDGQLRNWVFAMGYPLSEAYWTRARVGGVEKDVLIQVFERRVLTYTPSNSPDWRVEMANVGQHYYLWRYNRNLYDQ